MNRCGEKFRVVLTADFFHPDGLSRYRDLGLGVFEDTGGIDCRALADMRSELTPHRYGQFEHVILAPHSIARTNELFRDIGRTACQSIVDLARGRQPRGCVNPRVFDRPTFQDKWSRLCNKES